MTGRGMRYLSVCSGIEAASVAWEGLGWTPVGFSEIDKFASAVLAERFGSNLPGEPLSRNAPPNFGDFTAIPLDELGSVDLLVGGTPCQAFSFAGKRLSLADARGNLTLAYAVLAHELAGSHGLRNALWENVPGVLSTEDNAFGCFLGALVGADDALDLPKGVKRWPDAGMVAGPRARAAWRVLDAQYFGLAQRRERVFVVVDFGNGADPAAVLFEPQGLQGNSPPRREAGQGTAAAAGAGPGGGSGTGVGGRVIGFDGQNLACSDDVFATLDTGAAHLNRGLHIAHTLRGEGFDASEDGTGRGTPLVPVCFDTTQITSKANRSNPKAGDPCHPLAAQAHPPALAYRTSGNCGAWETGDKTDALTTGTDRTSHIIAFSCKDHGADAGDEIAPTLRAMGHGDSHPNAGGQVAVAFSIMPQNSGKDYKARKVEVAQPLMAGGPVGGNQGGDYVLQHWAVRRLTPTECARLQGFPDHHSRIPWRGKPAAECPDGPQYKTYGNSMAVTVMRWIGERIASYSIAKRTAA